MNPTKKLLMACCLVLLLLPAFASAGGPEAVAWLETHQQPDGSFGAWQEHATATAALALRAWNSSNASLSSAYLSAAAENPDSWFYGAWGEADVPGIIAYSLAETSQAVNASAVAANVLPFQNSSSGGFRGYYDFGAGAAVDSSVDSASALLGLSLLGVMPAQNSSAAVSFLSSLQNADGSFNLTTSRSFDAIYSLGPNQDSETALALLALRAAGVAESDSHIQNALGFLRARTESNFSGSVYAASLAALVFNEFGDSAPLSSAVSFISSIQNADGGFADAARSSNASNALDTGFAAYALSLALTAPTPTPSPSPSSSPSPLLEPTPSPTFPPSSATRSVYVRIYFPQGSGRVDVSSQVECGHALECFAAVASVSCTYYAASGPLYCAGVSQNCFVIAVDNVAPSDASDYWRFEVNGVPAPVGVSCYQPSDGDALVLRYIGNYAVAPAPTISLSPTPGSTSSGASPSPSPTPSFSPTPAASPKPRRELASTPTPVRAFSASPLPFPSSSPPSSRQPIQYTGFASAVDSQTGLVSLLAVCAFALLVVYLRRRK